MEQKIKNSLDKLINNSLWTLTKKELTAYFASPLFYIVAFLFIFSVTFILFGFFNYINLGRAELTLLFTAIAAAFVVVVPALTMNTISKEKQDGTLELVLTQPISEVTFVLAKFFSVSILIGFLLVTTLPISLTINSFSPLDMGQLTMQYIGAFILGLCFAAIGIAGSSFFKSEIASLLTSLVISFIFVMLGSSYIKIFPFEFNSILEKISLFSHFQSVSRGVLDLTDVFFFFAFILIFLSIAYFFVINIKYPVKHKVRTYTQSFLVIMIIAGLFIGYFGNIIPGRIDFTEDKIYTLSDSSKKVIDSVDEDLRITFYASNTLPAQFQSDKRMVEDLLNDYKNESGKIKVETVNPDRDEETKEKVSSIGLNELLFAVDTDDSSQRTVGYFGIGMEYQDKVETITLDQGINDLEFQLTKKIKKLTATDKKVVGFVVNNVARDIYTDFQQLGSELNELYEVTELNLTEENPTIPENVTMIILPAPAADFGDTVENNLKAFVENGKSILLLTNTVYISQEDFTPVENDFALADLFTHYGVTVNTDLTYDLYSSNVVDQGDGVVSIPVRYPLWVIALPADKNIELLEDVDQVSLLWASSIKVANTSSDVKITKLLETSEYGNVQAFDDINLDPNQEWVQKQNDSERTLAVAIENANGGRAVVVGESTFMADSYITNSQNYSFALGSVEWLLKDDSISDIKAKDRVATILGLNDGQKNKLVVASLLLPSISIILLGSSVYYMRMKNLNREYAQK